MQRKYTTVNGFTQGNSSGGLFEVVDAVVYGPPSAAALTGQCVLCLDQVGFVTAWAAEEATTLGLDAFLFRVGPDEDAGGQLQGRCGPLQQPIQSGQGAGGDEALEEEKAEGGYRQLPPDGEASLPQASLHPGRVEVVVELYELVGLRDKGAPALAAQQVAQDGLEVAFVGVLQHVSSPRLEHPLNLLEGGGDALHVMQHPHRHRGVEEGINEWQDIQVGGNVDIPPISPQSVLGLAQHGFGVVQQDDLLVAIVQVYQAAKAGANLHQPSPSRRQQLAQGDSFRQVLVFPPPPLPEVGPV